MFQCESNTMQNNIKSKFIWIFHAHAVKLSDIFHSIWVYMVGCCNLLQSIYEEGESKKKIFFVLQTSKDLLIYSMPLKPYKTHS